MPKRALCVLVNVNLVSSKMDTRIMEVIDKWEPVLWMLLISKSQWYGWKKRGGKNFSVAYLVNASEVVLSDSWTCSMDVILNFRECRYGIIRP